MLINSEFMRVNSANRREGSMALPQLSAPSKAQKRRIPSKFRRFLWIATKIKCICAMSPTPWNQQQRAGDVLHRIKASLMLCLMAF